MHDTQGRRVGKKVNGNLVQGFLYGDAIGPIAELDGQGHIKCFFLYGLTAHVPDAMLCDGQLYNVVKDPLGHVRVIDNADTGQAIQRINYDPFGNVLLDTNPGFQPFGFAGGLYDPQTRLVRFGARDYDPEIGLWTAKDPLNFAGGDTNLYAYAGNDPINNIDPSGEVAWFFFAWSAYDVGDGFLAWKQSWDDLGRDGFTKATIAGVVISSIVLTVAVVDVTNVADNVVKEGLERLARIFLKKKARANPDKALRTLTDDQLKYARGGSDASGFGNGISAEEITLINSQFASGTTLTGYVDSVIANAARHDGFFNKSASIIRDIAGKNLFVDGNGRTAHAVFDLLATRNNVLSGPTSSELRAIIRKVKLKELTEVEDIARALRGF